MQVFTAAGYLLQNKFGNYAIIFSATLAFFASFVFIGKECRNAEAEVDDDSKKTIRNMRDNRDMG